MVDLGNYDIELILAISFGMLGLFLFGWWKFHKMMNPPRVETKEKQKIEEKPDINISAELEKTSTSTSVIESNEEKLNRAMANTRSGIFGRIQSLFKADCIDLEEVEEVLYTSDIGPQTVQKLMDRLEERLKSSEMQELDRVKEVLRCEMLDILLTNQGEAEEKAKLLGLDIPFEDKPVVWIMVGVNGAGKTTTIGKLAGLLSQQGKKVLVAAGDTFRAAADEQLKVWSDRANVEIFSPENVTDPSAVAFDACKKAQSKEFDHLIIDTAGRLHTQSNLMEELKKLKRVVTKAYPEAPHEVLLVLDANNGQNALIQAKEFNAALKVTGVIFTKMDGTAKGGVAIGLGNELKIPIKRIGIGEKIEDLRSFNSKDFVNSIFS